MAGLVWANHQMYGKYERVAVEGGAFFEHGVGNIDKAVNLDYRVIILYHWGVSR